MRTRTRAGLVGLGASVAMACGGSSSSTPAAAAPPRPGFTITISNLAFSPLNLHAPPGATITVVNTDSMLHSVTSEARTNAFTPGAVGGVAFDTGTFTGTRSFTLPANAPNGTAIPYYCTVHLGTMTTPNGAITVDASAQGVPTSSSAPTAPSAGMPGY